MDVEIPKDVEVTKRQTVGTPVEHPPKKSRMPCLDFTEGSDLHVSCFVLKVTLLILKLSWDFMSLHFVHKNHLLHQLLDFFQPKNQL